MQLIRAGAILVQDRQVTGLRERGQNSSGSGLDLAQREPHVLAVSRRHPNLTAAAF